MSNALEKKAQTLWDAAGHDPALVAEVVGVGFEDPIDETITWYELPNVAVAGEFRVEPEDLRIVLEAAKRSGFHDPTGMVYIWHSHYIADEPSASDISNFPAWLCDAGIVYHVPSGVSRVYNSAGIFAEGNNSNSPHATQEVTNG